ncbi:MAG: hypothetical protein HQM07_02220 [Zetaproteobacteria bacterium]|nr:hypothetical protein [Zetaproteobacteria bacterium]
MKMDLNFNSTALIIDQLSLRERMLIFVTVLVVVGVGINYLLFEPLFVEQKGLQAAMSQFKKTTTLLDAQRNLLLQRPELVQHDVDHHGMLQLQLQEEETKLASLPHGVVGSASTIAVLETILQRHEKVQLISLRTVTPSTAEGILARAHEDNQPLLHKHTLEIVLRGQYGDILQYLQDLEQRARAVFYQSASLSVVSYPTSEVKLILYTLSLDANWIQL